MRTARIKALRKALEAEGYAGWIQPRADEFQGEYVPPSADRLAWLTGFTGSAGLAIVLQNKTAVFSDGRYTLQLIQETDPEIFETRHSIEAPASDWVTETLSDGEILAYDPWLLTANEVKEFETAAAKAGGSLTAAPLNLVDAVWTDRPAPPLAPIAPHPLKYAGEASADKRARLAAELAKSEMDAALITAPDGVALLLNVRGGDVAHTPLPLSFAILKTDASVAWFVDPGKLDGSVREWVGNEVDIQPFDCFASALEGFKGKHVLVPGSAPAAASQILETNDSKVTSGDDPTSLPKARKNAAEIAGTRAAHLRDAVAVTRFLYWLDTEAQAGGVTELQASDQLEAFRRELEGFRDLSFPTISGAGPNGAIVHYRVTPESDRALEPGSLYLVDSGGQFVDGTTDITRTVAIGAPTDEMRRAYTLVLKGHLALSAARFPKGITGAQLDSLARAPLWAAGLDFDHGTGHGVGSYLSVHEGPQRISKAGSAVLEPGMILSNEPGYYKIDAFGIRIENLILTEPVDIFGGERDSLGFETLTFAPYDRRLIDSGLLSNEEKSQVNTYHAQVKTLVGPQVPTAVAKWLTAATLPLET